MDAQEFYKQMKLIAEEHTDDEEVAHFKMDRLMCELLIDLGYEDGIEVFNEQSKYYA